MLKYISFIAFINQEANASEDVELNWGNHADVKNGGGKMFKLNYLFAVKNLLDKSRDRIYIQQDNKENEAEELFYWILGRMEAGIQNQRSPVYTIDVTISPKRIRLEEERTRAVYVPRYVREWSELSEIIQNVTNICNEVGGFLDNKFSAKFIKPESEENRGKLYVNMSH